ncbi:hypothetical protein GCM10011380_10560 [Sphingomonas metalli]|uniref:Uncharacterized protein n=1 Tax=Sphingomonas metalli TaxID=1779358 RepID=A0A916SYE1_9SPHN|nr:hypothetical protein GCM10011380_10560 [Sphingomonas metalli]
MGQRWPENLVLNERPLPECRRSDTDVRIWVVITVGRSGFFRPLVDVAAAFSLPDRNIDPYDMHRGSWGAQ